MSRYSVVHDEFGLILNLQPYVACTLTITRFHTATIVVKALYAPIFTTLFPSPTVSRTTSQYNNNPQNESKPPAIDLGSLMRQLSSGSGAPVRIMDVAPTVRQTRLSSHYQL
eukprot:6412803-Amphidinium_carterae.2